MFYFRIFPHSLVIQSVRWRKRQVIIILKSKRRRREKTKIVPNLFWNFSFFLARTFVLSRHLQTICLHFKIEHYSKFGIASILFVLLGGEKFWQMEKWKIRIKVFVSIWRREAFFGSSVSVWPDWVIYWTLGKFLKPLTTISLPESPTFLGNFC